MLQDPEAQHVRDDLNGTRVESAFVQFRPSSESESPLRSGGLWPCTRRATYGAAFVSLTHLLLHTTRLRNTHPRLLLPNSGHHNLTGSRAASERPEQLNEQSTCHSKIMRHARALPLPPPLPPSPPPPLLARTPAPAQPTKSISSERSPIAFDWWWKAGRVGKRGPHSLRAA